MAFYNCFAKFNLNFWQPSFNFNFGCFTMPNFSSFMPYNNNIFTLQQAQWFNNTGYFNHCSMKNGFNSLNNCWNLNFLPQQNFYINNNCWNNSFNQGSVWQGFTTTPLTFDCFNYSKTSSSSKKIKEKTNKTSEKSDINEKKTPSQLQTQFANKALSYVGEVNSDREGNRLFSNSIARAWCADFVTYVAKETFGNSLPRDFGSSAVSGLRDWAIDNDCYNQIPTKNKAEFIKNNVQVGDIMIEKNNDKSHTGIVTKVYDDGSFETVEGNCNNSVKKMKYNANSPTLSGFISLNKYA